MKHRQPRHWLVLIAATFLGSCAHSSTASKSADKKADTTIQDAVIAAKIIPTDSLETKVKKALTLINQDRYYYPKGPPPKLQPPLDHPYHLDSLRTPQQILRQKVGGYCGSAALVFSALLRNSGVSNEDMQIVAAVYAPDLKLICPHSGQPRIDHPRTGASGHVFVAVKFEDKQWRLINTVDGSNYESVNWMAPDELANQMSRAPVQIPFSIYKKFPPELRSMPMVVFQSWAPDQTPLHTFDQRLDMVASGYAADPNGGMNSKAKICRYGAKDVAALKKR